MKAVCVRLLVGCVLCFAMAGCEGIKVALGYPTDAEVRAAEAALTGARDRVEALEGELAGIAEAARTADSQAASAAATRAELLDLWSATSSQVATLGPEGADALLGSLVTMAREILAAGDAADRATALGAEVRAKLASASAARAEADEAIGRHEQAFEAMAGAADQAVASALGLVDGVGSTLAGLGVPGAEAATSTITGLGGGLLSLALGGGLLASRRRLGLVRREADAAVKVLRATKRHGLLAQESIAPNPILLAEAKAKARAEIGEAGLALLARVNASVEAPP